MEKKDMKNFRLIEQQGNSYLIFYQNENGNGEKLQIELTRCSCNKGKNSLPVLWKKHGYIDRVLEDYWVMRTYVEKGYDCFGKYNPQHMISRDGKKNILNFEWVFEATEENAIKLLKECEKMFLASEPTPLAL